MTTQGEPGEDGASHRLQGALGLLNVLVGIRLRGVQDPDSRRHLIWFNDIVAAFGLWNRRAVDGRHTDFADYLEAAAAFWNRSGGGRHVSIDRSVGPVALPDLTAASLSIITHELLGAAVAPDVQVALVFEVSQAGLILSVSSLGADLTLSETSRSLVQGLAEHLGGSLVLEAGAPHRTTVTLPTQSGPGVRH